MNAALGIRPPDRCETTVRRAPMLSWPALAVVALAVSQPASARTPTPTNGLSPTATASAPATATGTAPLYVPRVVVTPNPARGGQRVMLDATGSILAPTRTPIDGEGKPIFGWASLISTSGRRVRRCVRGHRSPSDSSRRRTASPPRSQVWCTTTPSVPARQGATRACALPQTAADPRASRGGSGSSRRRPGPRWSPAGAAARRSRGTPTRQTRKRWRPDTWRYVTTAAVPPRRVPARTADETGA